MRDTTKGILIGVLGAAIAVVAGGFLWRAARDRGVALTDGARINVPASAATVREILWEPADLLPAWINEGGENYEPRLSRDGRTLIFVRGKAGGGADLFAAELGDDEWSEPFPLTGINTPGADELGGVLSADGRTLYFYSDREGGQGGYDLWMARRAASDNAPDGGPNDVPADELDAGDTPPAGRVLADSLRTAAWDEPQNLGPAVNSAYNDYGPAPTPDGAALYFASNRPTPDDPVSDRSSAWPATVREDQTKRGYDLYVALTTDRGMGDPVRVDGLSTTANEGTPAVSPHGDFLYFASDRPGGAGGLDIYRARLRPSPAGVGGMPGQPGATGQPGAPPETIATTIGEAENLGWPVNSPANELDPALSMGGFALHFSSDRDSSGSGAPTNAGDALAGRNAGDQIESGTTSSPGSLSRGTSESPPPGAAADSLPHYAIYSTISREIYRVREPVLATIDWWGLWNALWPWLLLLALLGALLALLRRFLRDEDWQKRWRRLSLLAKCLILSLMLHALLAALFTVWYVSGSVGDLLRRSGGTRVALVSRGVGSDLASQIRGGLTDFTVRAEALDTLRATLNVERKAQMAQATIETEHADARDESIEERQRVEESRPAVPAPESTAQLEPQLAAAPLSLPTPQSAASTPTTEAAMQARVRQAASTPTAAPVPVSTSAPTARLQVEQSRAVEQAVAVPAEAAGAATSPASAMMPAVTGSTLRDAPTPAMGELSSLATPAASAPASSSEATARARAERLDSMSTPAPVPAAANAREAQIEVARSDAPDRAIEPQPLAQDAATAAAAPSPAPLQGAALIDPSPMRTPSVQTPEISASGARQERELAIRPASSPLGESAPALPNSAASADASASPTLSPERSTATPSDATLARESTLDAPTSAPSTSPAASAVELSVPTLTAAPSTALPDTHQQHAADEDALSVRPTPLVATSRPDSRLPAPQASPSQTAPAQLAPSSTGQPTADATLAAQPIGAAASPTTGASPSAPTLQIDIAPPSLVGVALPTTNPAARDVSADEPADRRSSTDLSPQQQTRPEGAQTPIDAAPPPLMSLDPARTSGNADTDTSLAADSPEGARGSRGPAGLTPTIGSVSPDTFPPALGTLPAPTLALPTFTEEPPPPPAALGTLAGVVTDAETGQPIPGARVRLDLTDSDPLVVRTNSRGQYTLTVPAGIPDNVAISAVAPGYTPTSINVPASQIERADARGRPLERDFALTPLEWAVVPIEEDPEVHHLGNDEFEGAINSQFQRTSEGLIYTAEFSLDADQVGRAIRAAELVLLAKGAQANNPIRINGRELEEYIVGTPRDGSFGELVFRINPRWLVEGENTVEIRSVAGSNDLDDYEFVNPRIRLRPTSATPGR